MTLFLHAVLWLFIGLFIGASLGVVIAGLCAAAGREPEGKMAHQVLCPNCGMVQHSPHCGNSDCRPCNDSIPPEGELYQTWTDDGEGISCPYCGFTAGGSFWEDLEIKALCKSYGVNSLTELNDKRREWKE
jgi:hypothetical protein